MRYRAYYETRPGKIIHRLRKAQNLTQEELAGNICSVATISRIENGSQIPTRKMFYRLLEQAGEFGFSYGDYYDGFTLQEMYLKREIILELEKEIEEINESHLWTFYQIYNKEDINERQFLEFAKMIYWHKTYKNSVNLIERLIPIIRMTHKEFDPRKKLKKYSYNQIQIMIINTIAIAFLEKGKPKIAFNLLKQLVKITKRSNYILPIYNKVRATLFNNLALCELALGKEYKALEHCKKAIKLCGKEGGGEFLLKLIRTNLYCLQVVEQQEEISKYKNAFYALYEILFEDQTSTPNEFLSNSKALMVF